MACYANGFIRSTQYFHESHAFFLQPYIGVFVVVYFDDILVFSKSMKEHLNHVRAVLQTLRKECLYANMKSARLVLTS